MNGLLLLFFAITSFYLSQHCVAQETSLTSSFETTDCFITFLDYCGDNYVIKQIKNSSPDEQFLLVVDALGSHIAETVDIPINKVRIIPANVVFPGKRVSKLPATLHTLAKGVSTDQECPYQGIDLHQRFRKENSLMWHRWGPLPEEETGLTLLIIQNMAKHPDLPRIVALDTFVGNADRSSPNLYYDKDTDRFCGIDMAASFTSPLAFFACRQLKQIKRFHLNSGELFALRTFIHTLEVLIKSWPVERQEKALLEYSEMAGFKNENFSEDQNLADRLEFHKNFMTANYNHCIELIKIIN